MSLLRAAGREKRSRVRQDAQQSNNRRGRRVRGVTRAEMRTRPALRARWRQARENTRPRRVRRGAHPPRTRRRELVTGRRAPTSASERTPPSERTVEGRGRAPQRGRQPRRATPPSASSAAHARCAAQLRVRGRRVGPPPHDTRLIREPFLFARGISAADAGPGRYARHGALIPLGAREAAPTRPSPVHSAPRQATHRGWAVSAAEEPQERARVRVETRYASYHACTLLPPLIQAPTPGAPRAVAFGSHREPRRQCESHQLHSAGLRLG